MKLVLTETIKKQLKKLDDPRSRGKRLVGSLSGIWRYRVMDYRIFCKIQDDKMTITALSTEHRRSVYKNQ